MRIEVKPFRFLWKVQWQREEKVYQLLFKSISMAERYPSALLEEARDHEFNPEGMDLMEIKRKLPLYCVIDV